MAITHYADFNSNANFCFPSVIVPIRSDGIIDTVNKKFGAGSFAMEAGGFGIDWVDLTLPNDEIGIQLWLNSFGKTALYVLNIGNLSEPGFIQIGVQFVFNGLTFILKMADDAGNLIVDESFADLSIGSDNEWHHLEFNAKVNVPVSSEKLYYDGLVKIDREDFGLRSRAPDATLPIDSGLVINNIGIDDFAISDTRFHSVNFNIPTTAKNACLDVEAVISGSEVRLQADQYEGDPKIILTENGAKLNFVDGQPVMDQGLENFSLISLLTKPGWAGNFFIRAEQDKIGSDFLETALETRTLSSLQRIENAAERALTHPLFESIDVSVSNPESHFVDVTALLKPPNQETQELKLTKNSANWQNQADNPANRRI